MKLKKPVISLISMLIILIMAILICDVHIENVSEEYIYSSIDSIPSEKTGLLLGTSKYLATGNLNPYFEYRLRAAVRLFRSGKIKYIIASGDNRRHNYNEPRVMKEELVKRGIPARAIYLDYAGFRTLDSVVRCSKIFGQDSFIVISQRFHNERAVFIARHFGIDAIGYNARDVAERAGLKTRVREYFARVKAFLDLYVTGKKPKYLGKKIEII